MTSWWVSAGITHSRIQDIVTVSNTQYISVHNTSVCIIFRIHNACVHNTSPFKMHQNTQYTRMHYTSVYIIHQCAQSVCTIHQNTQYIVVVDCLTSQQHESVSQGRICSDNFTSCHTEIEAAEQIFHLTQSQYTDTRPASPSTDPITPGAWQSSHWSAKFLVSGMTRPRKNPGAIGIRTRALPLSRRMP